MIFKKGILLSLILTITLCLGSQLEAQEVNFAEKTATMTVLNCLINDNLDLAAETLNAPGLNKALVAQIVLALSSQSGFSGISADGFELLFKSGAVTDWKDDDGSDLSLLVVAASVLDDPKVMKVICQHASNINTRFCGSTALLAAVARSNPNPEVIKVLLEAGADPNMKDVKGRTALDYMANMGEYKSLVLASDKKPNELLNTKDSQSNTLSAVDTNHHSNTPPTSNSKTVALMGFETDRVLVGIENELRHQFETHLSTIPGVSIITSHYYDRNTGAFNIYVSMKTSFKDKDRGLFRKPKRKYHVQLDARVVDTSNGNKTELLTATGEAEQKVEEIFPNDDYNYRQSKLANNNESDKVGYREAANAAMQNFCNHLQAKKVF